MTQAFNLAQLANNLNTSGQLDGSDGLSGAVPIANGGTGQTTAANAINTLLPSQTGNSGKLLTTNGSAASWDNAPIGITTTTGSAPYYAARAFVRTNLSSGTPTIINSQNVSSISDLGVGYIQVNFTTAMPDANYTVVQGTGNPTYTEYTNIFDQPNGNYVAPTTSSFQVTYNGQGGFRDVVASMLAVYR